MKTTLLCAALAAGLTALPAVADDTCPAVTKFAPGAISTPDHWEWRLTFTTNDRRAYWATSVGWWPATRERAEIRFSDYEPQNGGWQPAELAPFSGEYADFDPFVSPDGRTLYFSSMRPVNGAAKADMDLWQVRRHGNTWGTPTHIALPSLDGYDELYPSVDRAGNLYFARVKAPVPTEDVDIFVARRQSDGTYGPATRVAGAVDTPERWEFNPEISPDGRTLLFVRLDLPDALPDLGYGFGDLYVSRLRDGAWSAPLNLGPCVNTWNDEFHPTVQWDHRKLYFAKQLGGTTSDFYVTELRLPE